MVAKYYLFVSSCIISSYHVVIPAHLTISVVIKLFNKRYNDGKTTNNWQKLLGSLKIYEVTWFLAYKKINYGCEKNVIVSNTTRTMACS